MALSATALVKLGGGIQTAALPLLTAATTTNAGLVAGVTAAGLRPWLLMGIPAGAVVGRDNRGVLTVACDLARIGPLSAFGAAVAFGQNHDLGGLCGGVPRRARPDIPRHRRLHARSRTGRAQQRNRANG